MTYSFEGYSQKDIQEAWASILARLETIDWTIVNLETESESLQDKLYELEILEDKL